MAWQMSGRNGGGPRHRSLWLQEALDDNETREPLSGPNRADIVIVGGGYVGLWTAIRIKERDPSCDVVVLEADICGGGASGRNGGFALSWWAKLPSLVKAFGQQDGLRLARDSADAVDEIGAFCAANHIDAHFTKAGWLWTATTAAQLHGWEHTVAMSEEFGAATYERLSSAEVGRRAGSTVHLGGVLDKTGATVQPARLARGLARVAEAHGVRIYEHSRMVGLDRRRPPTVRVPNGAVVAEKVVLAINAWAAGLPELRMSLAVISSDVIATEQIPHRLAASGWDGGEAISDSQQMVDYYRTTRDGRIVFGKGGGQIAFGDRIGPGFDRNPRLVATVAADFRRTYPQLADVPIAADWSGPIDRSADGLPILGRLGGSEQILYGVGWSGNGVGPSVLGGRILASLALDVDDDWARSPLVERRVRRLPPEPIRYVGGQLVREGVRRKEIAEQHARQPGWLPVLLSRLVPAGLEDTHGQPNGAGEGPTSVIEPTQREESHGNPCGR